MCARACIKLGVQLHSPRVPKVHTSHLTRIVITGIEEMQLYKRMAYDGTDDERRQMRGAGADTIVS